MAEKEYIEQKTAFEMITNLAGSATTKSAYAAIWKCAWTVIDIPAADVVEIVYCKDCINRKTEDCAMYYRCNCGEQHTWENDNNYCSYGKRKGGADK